MKNIVHRSGFAQGEHRLIGFAGNEKPSAPPPPMPESVQEAPEQHEAANKAPPALNNDPKKAERATSTRIEAAEAHVQKAAQKTKEVPSKMGWVPPKQEAVVAERAAPAKTPPSKIGFVPERDEKNTTPEESKEAPEAASPEAATPATEVLPEDALQKQEQITALQSQIKEIDTKLQSKEISAEERRALNQQKEQLTADLNSLTEGVETQLKEPETKGELLQQQMEQGFEKLKKAEGMAETFAALIQIMGALTEYMKSAFDGTLNESLKKAEEAQKEAEAGGEGKKEGVEEKTGETPAEANKRLQEEVKEHGKKKSAEQPADAAPEAADTLTRNVEGVKEDKEAEIRNIDEDLKDIEGAITETKARNTDLLRKKSEMEQQLNELRGNDSMESEMTTLTTQLEAVQKSIDANNDALDALDKRHDDLTAKKESLTKDVAALDDMKKNVETAESRIAQVMKMITDIWNEKFPGKQMPTIDVRFAPDGGIRVSISGLDEEMEKALPEHVKVVNGVAEIAVTGVENVLKPPVKTESIKKPEAQGRDLRRELLLSKAQDYISNAVGELPGVRSAVDVQPDGNGNYVLSIDANIINTRAGDAGVDRVRQILMQPDATQNLMTGRMSITASADELEQKLDAIQAANIANKRRGQTA